jgi:hypothetical protein
MYYRLPPLIGVPVLILLLAGCIYYDDEPGEDGLENGPIQYRLSGEFDDLVTADDFDIRAEWRTENNNRVKAVFYASKTDTVENREILKNFALTLIRYREWPRPGNFGIASHSNLSADDDGRLFVSMHSNYREYNLDPDEENDFLHEDYDFTVTEGNFYITTSDDENLRGEFELFFRMDRKFTRDSTDQGTIGPINNALMIQGALDMNLPDSRVSNFSN